MPTGPGNCPGGGEGITTTIVDLIPGGEYLLSFWQAHGGFAGPAKPGGCTSWPHVIDQLLRSLGVRADAATVGSVRLCLSVGLDLDVGLFSKPWRVEVQDLKLELELGAAPAGDEAEDTAEAAGSAPSSSSSEDWLPLHRAAENLQLSLRNTVVVLRGLEPGRCLVIRLEQVGSHLCAVSRTRRMPFPTSA